MDLFPKPHCHQSSNLDQLKFTLETEVWVWIRKSINKIHNINILEEKNAEKYLTLVVSKNIWFLMNTYLWWEQNFQKTRNRRKFFTLLKFICQKSIANIINGEILDQEQD